MRTGVTTLISANYALTSRGDGDSFGAVTEDGKNILFVSNASDLSPARDDNGLPDLFVWREVPAGSNAELRVTTQIEHAQSVMIITLAVTNVGPESATGVVVHDALSAGATFASAHSTTGGACWISCGEVSCPLGTLERRGGTFVSWLGQPAGFRLESTEELEPSAGWSPIAAGIFDNGTMKTWPLTNGPPSAGFFRLHGP